MNNVFTKNNLKSHWLWIIFYLFLFTWLIQHSFAYLDNDYAWHLKFGQDIWQSGKLPEAQIHMWTLGDETWVDHEWASNLLTFGLAEAGGYVLVNVFYCLLILALLIYLTIRAKKRRVGGDYLIMLWQTLGLVGMMPHLGVRIQEIGLIFFTALLVLLDKYWESKKLFTLALILAPLFWLWACFHASFVIGVIIIWLFLLCRLLVERTWPGRQHYLVAASPIIATLITPYGLKLYDLLSEYRNTGYMSQIGEWTSVLNFPIHYYKLLFLAVLIAMSLMLYFSRGKQLLAKNYLFSWSLLLVLIAFSLRSIRHFPLLFIASHLFFLPLVLDYFQQNKSGINQAWLKFFVAASLSNLIAWQLINTNVNNSPFEAYPRTYPVAAVKYLREHQELKQLRLLNHYDWGGYLTYTLPDLKLFIDGRLPQKMYQGRNLIEVFSDFSKPNLLVEQLDKQGIELVLWKTKQKLYKLNYLDRLLGFEDRVINRPHNFLRYHLMTSPDWVKIYGDGTAEIYKKVKN